MIDFGKLNNLVKNINGNPNMTELEFQDFHLGNAGAQYLAEHCLGVKTSITKLHFCDNGIDDVGLVHIANALSRNQSLTTLIFDSNRIGVVGMRALTERLKENTTLTHLSLRSNSMGPQEAGILATFLQKGKMPLRKLDLSLNTMGREGIKVVLESLMGNRTLSALDLQGTGMDGKGAQSLRKLLMGANTALETLDLCDNPLEDKGVRRIVEGLRSNTTVTRIDLDRTGVGTESLNAFSNLLCEGKTALKVIRLAMNEIGDEGAKILAKGLNAKSIVTKLDLGLNGIGDEGAESLAPFLCFNNTLLSLDLRGNEIQLQGAGFLEQALRTNLVVQHLNLDGNQISEPSLTEVIVSFLPSDPFDIRQHPWFRIKKSLQRNQTLDQSLKEDGLLSYKTEMDRYNKDLIEDRQRLRRSKDQSSDSSDGSDGREGSFLGCMFFWASISKRSSEFNESVSQTAHLPLVPQKMVKPPFQDGMPKCLPCPLPLRILAAVRVQKSNQLKATIQKLGYLKDGIHSAMAHSRARP